MVSWSDFRTKIENCLCPPGNGVFTVNTAKERKESLHKALFGQTENVEDLWKNSLDRLSEESKVVILGISSDCGGGILRGANWGPLFLRFELNKRYGDLPGCDIGDVRVIPHLLHDKYLNDKTLQNCRKALYNDADSQYLVSPLSITENVAHDFYELFPEKGIFGIGGDHSVSYPLTKAYLQAKKKQGKRAAIIHFDAHTDLLVDRLGIDICFGSWCTHILNDLNDNSHLIQIGIRSTGKDKSHWETKVGVKQHWAYEIKEFGANVIVGDIINQLKNDQIDELYVSFDIDALDSSYASATGTPEPNGLSPEEVMLILRELTANFSITGGDMVEIAPFLNTNGDINSSAKTLKVGAEISQFLINEIEK